MRPEDTRFLERARKQHKHRLMTVVMGWSLIALSIAIPVLFPWMIRPAEQLLMSRINQRQAQLQAVKPSTPTEAKLLEELQRFHGLHRALLSADGALTRIAYIYLGGQGLMFGTFLLILTRRNRRYLRIIDELTTNSTST